MRPNGRSEKEEGNMYTRFSESAGLRVLEMTESGCTSVQMGAERPGAPGPKNWMEKCPPWPFEVSDYRL